MKLHCSPITCYSYQYTYLYRQFHSEGDGTIGLHYTVYIKVQKLPKDFYVYIANVS